MPPNMQRLRAVSDAHLPDALIIRGVRRVPDGLGGYTSEPYEVLRTKCRIKALSGSEQVEASRLTASVTASLACPAGTALSSSQSVEINGAAFNIVHVKSESYRAATRALIARAG